jgi:hypothetical protein
MVMALQQLTNRKRNYIMIHIRLLVYEAASLQINVWD